MNSFVRVDHHGQIAVVTLDRPERRNAIATVADCDAIVEALEQASSNPRITVLIITGAGSAFCAGGDLHAIRDRSGIAATPGPPEATRRNYRRGVHRVIHTLAQIEVATIAAVNGPAMGLGLDLALLCDLRVAASGIQLGSSFVKLGLIPGDAGAWILTQAAGPGRAAEMILTGDPISAEKALEFGLVNQLVPADKVMEAAHRLALRIAANPPRAVRLAKRLLIQSRSSSLAEMLELSAAFQALAHETRDHREAVESLIAKRPPRFEGD